MRTRSRPDVRKLYGIGGIGPAYDYKKLRAGGLSSCYCSSILPPGVDFLAARPTPAVKDFRARLDARQSFALTELIYLEVLQGIREPATVRKEAAMFDCAQLGWQANVGGV